MINDYETEARSRWGATDAYREHEQKTKNYTKEKWAEANDGMMAIFAEFAACKNGGASADSAEAQALVAKLQIFTMGKYFERDGKRMLPLAIQVHHAVCDGYHVGLFVEKLQKYINEF